MKIDGFKEKVKEVIFFNDMGKHKFKLKKEQLTIAIPDDKKNEIKIILE